MWVTVENSNEIKPDEIDTTSSPDTVYVRKDFELIPESENCPAHWTYLERKFTRQAYDLYKESEELKAILAENDADEAVMAASVSNEEASTSSGETISE